MDQNVNIPLKTFQQSVKERHVVKEAVTANFRKVTTRGRPNHNTENGRFQRICFAICTANVCCKCRQLVSLRTGEGLYKLFGATEKVIYVMGGARLGKINDIWTRKASTSAK